MQRLIKEPVGKDARPALNDRHTMTSTSEDLVKWYQQALRGAFFKQPDTLLEFKRIQAMADALAYVALWGVVLAEMRRRQVFIGV